MNNAELAKSLLQVDSSFTDYVKFEVEKEQRDEQKKLFINGEIYAPDYRYLELSTLYDTKTDDYTGKRSVISAKKMAIQYAIMELESLSSSGKLDKQLAGLYAAYYEKSLKKIMLVEAARDLLINQQSSSQESLRKSFLNINQELYGEFDQNDFRSILSTEFKRLDKFSSGDLLTQSIVNELVSYLVKIGVDKEPLEEIELIDQEFLDSMFPVLKNKFSYIWESVPSTSASVYYNAEESKQMIDLALFNSGLSKYGWSSKISPYKKVPSTSSDIKMLSLPTSTSRNAQQLRALIIHEIGVHAQRAQNGEKSGLPILIRGTASYADIEEGLGVLLECISTNSVDNLSFHRARDRYITAGIALGDEYSQPKDARQTFEILWRIIACRKSNGQNITSEIIEQSKNEAFDHVENAFRGTNFSSPGVIYSKLKIYREGLIKNVVYFRNNIKNLDIALDNAMIGKYNHTDTEEFNIVSKLVRDIDKIS